MNQEFFIFMLHQSALRLLGGALLAFFIVFAFLRERIQRPRICYWAFWTLGVGMLLPVVSVVLMSTSVGFFGSTIFALGPVALLIGVLLLIWSCVPMPEHAAPLQMRFAESKHAKPAKT